MEVPVVDCDQSIRSDLEIARDIDSALRNVGFMAVRNLGVTPERIVDVFSTAKSFFQCSEQAKQRCAYEAAMENFGYQGIGEESLDPSRPGDLKETFTMRNLLAKRVSAERWPTVEFRQSVSAFYQDALSAAQRLQRLLALALDVPTDYFVNLHGGENITLRLLHYPAVTSDTIDPQQMGAGAHTDYGMLTLLFQDAVGGLQVQSESGTWHDVPPRPDAIVINSGDLLERWSNGRYRSTCHRVLPRQQSTERYSIALFVDPDSDTLVEALPSCVEAGAAALHLPITAGEHLQAKIEATHHA
ncbi:2OG-Fe(II) oxygenase family protein [Congregibacter variabilis]|uniref:2-oxoglutarate-dependent ethylene/succinate-forming enzyme n=1 Tax=Congregibacter variabilis TaxID=3081200 RepID=A0ABZ0I3M7_9GAMM|nr:2OG-Fe(II) oxygenase family protein [Congregibacter sp. IMCC43200]